VSASVGEQLQILVVCRANLCRSPMAERLTSHLLSGRSAARAAGIVVHSAGTHATDGQPMHPWARKALVSHGVLDDDFLSRRLQPALLQQANLVLTASRVERAHCARLAPTSMKRTFTLFQFARLASIMPGAPLNTLATPAQRLAAVLASVPLLRTLAPAETADDDDLPDPVSGPVAGFQQCAQQISRAVERIATVIAPH